MIVIIPIIYSLNRGLWIGLIFAVVYLALRLAAQGRLAVLGGLLSALVLAVILICATPLQGMISQRLANGASDARRGSLAVATVQTRWPRRCWATGIPGTSRAASSPSPWGARLSARPAVTAPLAGTASSGCCSSAMASSALRCMWASSPTDSGDTGETDALRASGRAGAAPHVHLHDLLQRNRRAAGHRDVLLRHPLAERTGPAAAGGGGAATAGPGRPPHQRPGEAPDGGYAARRPDDARGPAAVSGRARVRA